MDDVFSKVAQQFDLTLIVQFGSTVNGGRGLSLNEEVALRAALAEVLDAPEDKTDLVFLHRASPLLAYEALWQGKLLYGDTKTLRINQVRAWKRLQEDKKFARWRHEYIKNVLTMWA